MPATSSLLANVLCLISIILASLFGFVAACFPEAMIFCALVMVCRNLNAVQMEVFALRRAMGDKRALPIELKPSVVDQKPPEGP